MKVAMNVPREAQSERRSPEIVQEGRPAAVISNIDDHQDMLERLEDLDDLKMLRAIREEPPRFRKLDEFLAEYRPSV